MTLSISDLINRGEYWSTIATHESQPEVLDLCKLRPIPPPGDPKVTRLSRRNFRRSLSSLDNDPTEVGQ